MLCFLKKMISKQPPACTGTTGTKPPSEYAVYIYYPNPNKNSGPKWRKVSVTQNATQAVKHARILHQKRQYQRIEIKKCTYSENQNKTLCKTIRVYDRKRRSFWEKYTRAFSISS